MKIKTYLEKHNMTPAQFGSKIGVTAQAVRNWSKGKRHPRPEHISVIESLTNGAVKPVDWFN